jgi:protocatechuate 3,4-dioxygenase beta subunit
MKKKFSRRTFIATMGLTVGSMTLTACGANSTATPLPSATPAVTPTVIPATIAPTNTTTAKTGASPATGGGNTITTCTPTNNVAQGGTPLLQFPEPAVWTKAEKGHVLRGVVQSSRNCEPLKQAKLVFWWANPVGQYDSDHRATIFTKDDGTFELASSFPGVYEGASPHFHLAVWANDHQPIETAHLTRSGQTEGKVTIVLAPK